MVQTQKIDIANDYTRTPGFRKKEQGKYSGEEFRERFLEPIFNADTNAKVEITLDGVLGYATSFLEEVFGGLARKFPNIDLNSKIKVISKEEPYLVDDIRRYIADANK